MPAIATTASTAPEFATAAREIAKRLVAGDRYAHAAQVYAPRDASVQELLIVLVTDAASHHRSLLAMGFPPSTEVPFPWNAATIRPEDLEPLRASRSWTALWSSEPLLVVPRAKPARSRT